MRLNVVPALLFPLSLHLSACDTGSVADDALEGFSFETDALSESEQDTYVFTGSLSASGADRDYTLRVSDGAGTALDAEVHSPGDLDLSTLSGQTGTVSIYTDWTGAHARLVAISTEDGLAYVANRGMSGGDLDTWFGADFATYGAELGTSRDTNFNWTYHTVRFQTDEGPVEIAPGELDTLTIGGELWQVVVIAAYDRELRPNGSESDCGPPEDLISYEMMRVPERVAPTAVLRQSGREIAEGPGCGG